MKFAIIEDGGKQYKVEVGTVLNLEKKEAETGTEITFPFVVLTTDEDKTEVGTPFLSGITVSGKVLDHGKADKIRVVHKQSKKRMHKARGHRQPFTQVEITSL